MESLFQYLASLSEEHFVLHGSPNNCPIVLPRQTLMDGGRSEYQEYAVYGSLCVEAALLYSVIHERRDWWGWYIDENSKPPQIVVRSLTPISAKNGFVHLLPRAAFTKSIGSGLVCLAYEPVRPTESLPVPAEMLQYLKQNHIRMESL